MVRTRRLAAVLGASAEQLRIGPPPTAKGGCKADRLRFHHPRRSSAFLFAAPEFRGDSVLAGSWGDSARWQWTESTAAVSGDGDPSADAVSRLCRVRRSLP